MPLIYASVSLFQKNQSRIYDIDILEEVCSKMDEALSAVNIVAEYDNTAQCTLHVQ